MRYLGHKFKLDKVKSHLVVKLTFGAQYYNSKQIFTGIKVTVTATIIVVQLCLVSCCDTLLCAHTHTYTTLISFETPGLLSPLSLFVVIVNTLYHQFSCVHEWAFLDPSVRILCVL